MSFIVIRPTSLSLSSKTKIFSILCLYIKALTLSCVSPSLTVINLSLGVIISETNCSSSRAYLKSLLVTMPFNSSSSTTGIPEIFNSLVSCTNSFSVLVDLIVIGSRTMPLSNFLTCKT